MIAFILSILSLFLFSFTVSVSIAGDIWQQLGIPQEQGTEKIKKTFLNNYLICIHGQSRTYGIRPGFCCTSYSVSHYCLNKNQAIASVINTLKV